MKRIIAFTGLAVITAIVLAGCTSYVDHKRNGGQTPEKAIRQLESIEGVTSANFKTEAWRSDGEGGFLAENGMNLELDIVVSPNYKVVNPAKFLNFISVTAWSINDKYPKGALNISLKGGVDGDTDWAATVKSLFPSTERVGYIKSAGKIAIDTNALGKIYGEWPAAPQTTPSGLIVEGKINAGPGFEFEKASSDKVGDQVCLNVLFKRATNGNEAYSGTINLGLQNSAGTVLTSQQLVSPKAQSLICFPSGTDLTDTSNVRLTYAGEAEALYSTVDEASRINPIFLR